MGAPLPSANLAGRVFHCLSRDCLNCDLLEALTHTFISCHHPSHQISQSIIVRRRTRHQKTAQGITYIFYFQPTPPLSPFFFSLPWRRGRRIVEGGRGHFIILPYRIRLKKPLMRTYAGRSGEAEISHQRLMRFFGGRERNGARLLAGRRRQQRLLCFLLSPTPSRSVCPAALFGRLLINCQA